VTDKSSPLTTRQKKKRKVHVRKGLGGESRKIAEGLHPDGRVRCSEDKKSMWRESGCGTVPEEGFQQREKKKKEDYAAVKRRRSYKPNEVLRDSRD